MTRVGAECGGDHRSLQPFMLTAGVSHSIFKLRITYIVTSCDGWVAGGLDPWQMSGSGQIGAFHGKSGSGS